MLEFLQNKICIVCKESKPVTEYHKDKYASDGKRSKCKSCCCRLAKEWQGNNKERNKYNQKMYSLTDAGAKARRRGEDKYRNSSKGKLQKKITDKRCKSSPQGKLVSYLSNKKYRNTSNGKVVTKKSHNKYCAKNAIKRNAKRLVRLAVISGKLHRPTVCDTCFKPYPAGKLHGHHSDYSLPLVVLWLCALCHKKWHRENGPGLNG